MYYAIRFALVATLPLAGSVSLAQRATPTEVSSGTLAADTPFATPYFLQQAAQPGPTVLITGGVHGDEPAGAAAAEAVRQWTIVRGRLIVIPRMNVTGLAAQQRRIKGVDASLADLNRDFPRSGREEAPRGALAQDIWRFVAAQKPDWLLDMHEAHSLRGTYKDSVGNTILSCPAPQMSKVLPRLLDAVNATLGATGQKFVVGRRPKDGTLARAAAEHQRINSLLVETTKAGQPLALRVKQHCEVVAALLRYLEMTPPVESPPAAAKK